jgi:flagellar hook-associated protein 3 FlgL
MRITNSMMMNSMMINMNKNMSRMSKTEENLATGKKFLKPSDDPIGVSRSLRLNTDVANMAQFKRNAEDAESWLDTTEMAVNNVIDVLQRARELTVKATSDTNSLDERNAIATEISQLKDQLINIANTNYAGSYIFSGFKTNKPCIGEDGKYSFQENASDPAQTLKASEGIEFNVGIGDRIGINFTAQKLFGVMKTAAGTDDPINGSANVSTGDTPQTIAVFDQLIADLGRGDTEGIKKALNRMDIQLNNANAVRAEIGVKSNRLDLTMNRIEDDSINLQSLLSKNEDADIAEVIMNLKMQENIYKASLSGGANIIQPSLMDFLR